MDYDSIKKYIKVILKRNHNSLEGELVTAENKENKTNNNRVSGASDSAKSISVVSETNSMPQPTYVIVGGNSGK